MALLKGINNSKSWTGVGDIIMVTRVIPFFSPLWFIIRHQNNTHTQSTSAQHTRAPEGSTRLFTQKWVDWLLEEAEECRARRVVAGVAAGQDNLSGREVEGGGDEWGPPGHAWGSWRNLLSLRRHHSDWGKRRGRRQRKLKECSSLQSAPVFLQEDHPRTSGIPPLEDTPLWSVDTPKAPGAKHTPPLTLWPPFPHPQPFFLFYEQAPNLLSSGKRKQKLVL